MSNSKKLTEGEEEEEEEEEEGGGGEKFSIVIQLSFSGEEKLESQLLYN